MTELLIICMSIPKRQSSITQLLTSHCLPSSIEIAPSSFSCLSPLPLIVKFFSEIKEPFVLITVPFCSPSIITPSSIPIIVRGLVILIFPLYTPEDSLIIEPAGALSIASCKGFALSMLMKNR